MRGLLKRTSPKDIVFLLIVGHVRVSQRDVEDQGRLPLPMRAPKTFFKKSDNTSFIFGLPKSLPIHRSLMRPSLPDLSVDFTIFSGLPDTPMINNYD